MKMLARHAIVGLALVAAGVLPLPASAADSSPKGFLASIYGSQGKAGAPIEIPCNPASRAEIEQHFAPAVVKLVSWSLQHVDGCVFTGLDGSEDWVADTVDINIAKSDQSRAVGIVTLMVHGKEDAASPQKSTLTLNLVKSGRGWRIADIDYGDSRLSQLRGH